MKRWPLRLKVSLWAVTLGGITLLAIGTLIAWNVRRVAVNRMDAALLAEATGVSSALEKLDAPVDWSDARQVAQLLGRPAVDRVVQIEQPPGTVVYSPADIPIPPAPEKPTSLDLNGRPFRAVQVITKGRAVRVAASMEGLAEINRTLWITCIYALPVVLISMGIGGWWLSRKVLRPVEELADAASEIDARTSDRQLPSTGTNDEIGHLTDVLNGMFGRIRESFVQARRFSADASHELKTPLTIIRGEVEAALRSPHLSPQIEKTMLDLHEETGRLINIVEGLLLLSQADAGKLQFDMQPVNFSLLLSEIVEDIEILASPREISVDTDFQASVLVEGSAQFLRQVALNLFDNAIKYNIDRGEIRATLSIHNGLAVFAISNTGVPIPPDDRARIFDRFHRADQSRERKSGGQGLGLSICREIVRSHGGDITLEPSPAGWVKFQMALPSRDMTQSAVRRADKNTEVPSLANEAPAVVTKPRP